MTRIIFISHNKLAAGMKAAVEMIAGQQDNLEAYGLMPGQNPDEIISHLRTTITPDEHVLILADLVGGSMCNAAMALLNLPNVKLLGGMNLALALQVVLTPPKTDDEIDHMLDQAKTNLEHVVLKKVTNNDGDAFF
ncbi:PTS sugar transporter subunit IIA [Schleiferilactobacillus harbinensis]|jgi:PTS system mannose-specific IIA component|uniref:PTS mannose transporter subunit IIA n=1 Tax=Schleiferilactobacillus harbinensis TaxID=304207 RepID=A0A510TX54_9LACO|nr:PTS mannose transporter subunit IIA [Schleiferilactobacillus harbinensis]MCI1687356.1 PTS mannose transporter subunit IIA [Schleiferilactobacillus harbinensis]MCI1783694.1 PTS mannose transporter subunit IIA [Schleiferilactobacillus harbinensis]MCI1851549.1 PTS mannose transporter subunit IIA [Schleiferilactobacillus harbinensis]QEU47608.1 PTS mannose transporter subunit IIA [Schleiferilactobacillus harbinensis]QFR24674.1 PTS mannose transporter subunit IIA [Schleiferilactobacillus harbinen